MKKILVPVDGSETSYLALAKAGEFAAFFNATVLVIHVYDVGKAKSFFNDEKTIDKQAELTEKAEEITANAGRFCEEKGIPCETATLEGDPADRIIEYANEHDVDMIVMGTQGMTGLRRLIGSTTSKVLVSTHRPVLVIQ